jgi:hypothetical protein
MTSQYWRFHVVTTVTQDFSKAVTYSERYNICTIHYTRAVKQYIVLEEYYNILQYIVTNTIYCMIKSIAIVYCIVVPKHCNILYCWSEVLQYIVLLIWSIALYCIAELKDCNVLYCQSEVLQYIVHYHTSTFVVCKLYSNITVNCILHEQYQTVWQCCLRDSLRQLPGSKNSRS